LKEFRNVHSKVWSFLLGVERARNWRKRTHGRHRGLIHYARPLMMLLSTI